MIVNSTLLYIRRDDCYLMLHRTKKEQDINKDKWLGIGGRLEPGESPYDCIIRETVEETSIALSPAQLSYRGLVSFVDGDYTEHMHLFTAATTSDCSGVCDEGELCWVDISGLLELELWEGDRIFLSLIKNPSTPFFSLKLIYSDGELKEAYLNGENMTVK